MEASTDLIAYVIHGRRKNVSDQELPEHAWYCLKISGGEKMSDSLIHWLAQFGKGYIGKHDFMLISLSTNTAAHPTAASERRGRRAPLFCQPDGRGRVLAISGDGVKQIENNARVYNVASWGAEVSELTSTLPAWQGGAEAKYPSPFIPLQSAWDYFFENIKTFVEHVNGGGPGFTLVRISQSAESLTDGNPAMIRPEWLSTLLIGGDDLIGNTIMLNSVSGVSTVAPTELTFSASSAQRPSCQAGAASVDGGRCEGADVSTSHNQLLNPSIDTVATQFNIVQTPGSSAWLSTLPSLAEHFGDDYASLRRGIPVAGSPSAGSISSAVPNPGYAPVPAFLTRTPASSLLDAVPVEWGSGSNSGHRAHLVSRFDRDSFPSVETAISVAPLSMGERSLSR